MSDQDPGAPNNPEWPNSQDDATTPAGGQPQGQSRRAFLRASVIASAAVVAAGAAVVAESPLGPKFLSTIGVAHAANSNPATCATIVTAFQLNNNNDSLIIDPSNAASFPTGTCFTLTDKNLGGSKPVMFGTIASVGYKAGGTTQWQLNLVQDSSHKNIVKYFATTSGGGTCQPTPTGNYPQGSSLCQAPCTLTCS